ncbi:MAG: UDP-glucose 4-epimerase [Planctomycetaceae bacterium]|nr:MAG: UDP-glucose 4-epimerase [Planctomycetaceae bacterium]
MRVLITGGAGFIGSHIVDACLQAGYQPAVIDDLSSGSRENLPSDIPFYQTDICDAEAVERICGAFRPDVICHQAAQMSVSRSVREPEFDARVNVLGLLHVFSSGIRHGARRLVFASSGGVLYGDVYEPAAEDTPPRPISPYGITKLAGELYLQYFVREHRVEGIALRYANVYGPRQNPHGEAGVVAIFCQRLLSGQPATIHGDGLYDRDYVFGPDVARANLLAMTANLPERFMALNIGTGQATNVIQLEERIRREVARVRPGMQLPSAWFGPARPGDLRSSIVDARRAHEVLGWHPSVSLEEGLQRTVHWFAERVVPA